VGNTLDHVQYTPQQLTRPPILHADMGYVGYKAHYTMVEHGYVPQIISGRQEAFFRLHDPNFHSHRWVVERCHSWLNRFRKILIRFEKTVKAHYALLCFAAAVIVWRKVISR
jgi:hypothetical protein